MDGVYSLRACRPLVLTLGLTDHGSSAWACNVDYRVMEQLQRAGGGWGVFIGYACCFRLDVGVTPTGGVHRDSSKNLLLPPPRCISTRTPMISFPCGRDRLKTWKKKTCFKTFLLDKAVEHRMGC